MTDAKKNPQQILIGVDVGGTKCAAGLVRIADGAVVARLQEPTRPEQGGAALLATVVEMTKELLGEAAKLDVVVAGVGVGVAELVDPGGRIVSGATIAWEGVAVDEEIARLTGLPVCIDADVRAAARAEACFGAGRDFRHFLYVTVGTGISSSLVIHRVPYTGARGLTGTIASTGGTIPADDGTLATGPPLEQFASGPAIAARLTSMRSEFRGAGPEVLALAERGNLLAAEILWSAGTALGAAIGQLVNALDPEAVVIGGGLGLVEGAYRRAIDEAMRRHIWSDRHRDLPLLSAATGPDAGIIGAALAAASLASASTMK